MQPYLWNQGMNVRMWHMEKKYPQVPSVDMDCNYFQQWADKSEALCFNAIFFFLSKPASLFSFNRLACNSTYGTITMKQSLFLKCRLWERVAKHLFNNKKMLAKIANANQLFSSSSQHTVACLLNTKATALSQKVYYKAKVESSYKYQNSCVCAFLKEIKRWAQRENQTTDFLPSLNQAALHSPFYIIAALCKLCKYSFSAGLIFMFFF